MDSLSDDASDAVSKLSLDDGSENALLLKYYDMQSPLSKIDLPPVGEFLMVHIPWVSDPSNFSVSSHQTDNVASALNSRFSS